MQLQQNVSLRPYNTFGIDVPAEYFATLTKTSQLEQLSRLPYQKHVLGGGSNVLLTGPVQGIVIHNELKEILIIDEDADHVWLQVGGGEIWHDLVQYAVRKGFGGIENLALIPGTVGAAPMQNIGAYGAEARQTIETVTYWRWDDETLATINNDACRFGYRDSIFKHELKDKVLITSVVFRLSKQPVFNTSYGAIEQELEKMGISALSLKAVMDAVISIRTSKLPDPKQIGNAGSFFKNPTIGKQQYETLLHTYSAMPSYPAGDTQVKIPAGWLIENCGWKGYRKGDIGVHARQALVLVNYGQANGGEIWQLSGEILRSVHDRFGIELEREVQVW